MVDLSVAGPGQVESVLSDESVAASGPVVMAELLAGLRRAAAGEPPGINYTPFLGWTVGRRWVLDGIGSADVTTR